MTDLFFLACVFLLGYPRAASAYLDPNAGNALIYIAVTLVSVAAYSAKSIFYRLTRKNFSQKSQAHNDIVIFSEGKNYWNTFSPIINALLKKNQPFSYYTMDIEDDGLKIRSPLMKARYLSQGGGGGMQN